MITTAINSSVTDSTIFLIKNVRDIINHPENHSPYHWVHIEHQFDEIKRILKTDGIDKKLADQNLTHSLMGIFLKRSARLIEVGAPIDVLLGETEAFQLAVNSIKLILFNDCYQLTREYYQNFSSNQEKSHE
jgi:hypothetical protein